MSVYSLLSYLIGRCNSIQRYPVANTLYRLMIWKSMQIRDTLKYASHASSRFATKINYFARLRCFVSFERIWLIEDESQYKSNKNHSQIIDSFCCSQVLRWWLDYQLSKSITISHTYNFNTLLALQLCNFPGNCMCQF